MDTTSSALSSTPQQVSTADTPRTPPSLRPDASVAFSSLPSAP